MNSLDTGKDKIKKICDILQSEALQPARQEAATLVAEAQKKAQDALEEAQQKASSIMDAAKARIEKERMLFEQSIQHAFVGVKERLRQEIERSLLHETLAIWIQKNTADALTANQLIKALIEMLHEGGIDGDFSALIPQKLKVHEVNALLGEQILNRLKEGQVIVGEFQGGVRVKLHDKKITLDLSDEAIEELLTSYISKEFRDIIFQPVKRS
ncbi:MAG: V-type ATP synthase subunit E [Verrucomicrobia bacterium]|nr:V-type ATP synthase subunit E [Verrucomicrobiota bacterium]MBS0645610.1 V-type ATP synthase subunit E [Verrucomicrobiota bacterium]